MSEQPKQEWRLEFGKVGEDCMITCNGEPVYACAATLHMEPGAPTTLHLQFPIYGPYGLYSPTFQRHDEVVAEVHPMVTTIEIAGRQYRLMEMTRGDLDDGLFRERRATGNAHQSL